MSEASKAQKERLMADLHMVVAQAEELLRVTAGQTGEGVADMRAKLQAKLSNARDSLSHVQDAAIERAKAAGHAADEYVHDNPWRAIGAAAGVGLIVGLLIGRR
ncbi:MAG: DUF883 family protein [Burkholderiaceae bacterium]|nr:DUF883 family protein [Burkholderiaceae bacterium]MBT9503555.1 DUF883 family protein [Burkholderiaceae bacterium]